MKELILPDGFEIDRIEGNKVILKEKELPKTWEEWVNQNHEIHEEWFIEGETSKVRKLVESCRFIGEDENLLPSEETAKAILTLIKLLRLRDAYRQGWKPDYSGCDDYYSIFFIMNEVDKITVSSYNSIFSFQSEEIRDQFFYNFKDMLDKLKCLF